MSELIETVREELEERTTRNFTMSNVPVPTLKEFKLFCKEECGDVYAVGLFQLMKTKKLYENMMPLLANVLQELNEIKSKMDNQKTQRRELKTFE